MDLAFQVRGDYSTLLDTARFSEANGLVAMALPDHYLASRTNISDPAYDALTQLGGLVRDTATLELSTLVSPVTFRHPAVTLKSAVSLDQMSGGRFSLGLGTGWFEEEHDLFGIPFPDRRFDLLDEALAYTRAGMEGRGFDGEHFRLTEFDIHPRPQNLRIVVGGSGPTRTPELAGRYADEFNVYAGPVDEMGEKIGLARQTAQDCGRDPEALLISTAAPVVTGTDEAAYRRALSVATERFDQEPDALEKRFRDRGIPVGLDAAETIAAMEGIGVRRFYLQMFGTDPERRTDMLAALGA